MDDVEPLATEEIDELPVGSDVPKNIIASFNRNGPDAETLVADTLHQCAVATHRHNFVTRIAHAVHQRREEVINGEIDGAQLADAERAAVFERPLHPARSRCYGGHDSIAQTGEVNVEHWKTVVIDDPTMWPASTKVPLPPEHADARGSVQTLVNLPMKNAALITSKKGTLRSNHYHKTDWHFIYVLSGSLDYYFRPTGSNAKPECVRCEKGDLFFTPPLEDHATVFLEDTVILVLSRNPRDQESYEADVERVQLVDPGTIRL